MKDIINKIVNSFLALAFVAGIVTIAYHATRFDADKLSASILDGREAAEILSAEFVSPKGAAYPVNGVVTINSVFVKLVAPFPAGIVSGSDLENSFITFNDSVPACPAGTVFLGNKIILPSNFSASCKVQIEVSGAKVNPVLADLTIEPVSCSTLRTSIVRGYGSGFQKISLPVVLPTSATTVVMSPFDFSNPINSIDLNYPTTTVDGAKTFQIHLDFVPDIAVDPLNGIAGRAEITANNGNEVYSIKVKNEGTGLEVKTAMNFAYVFNDLLGVNSPFTAYMDTASDTIIQLESRELGLHTNSYNCLVGGGAIAACFAGATAGNDGVGNPLEVLTRPLTLDSELVQGESALVFAANSAGEIQWVTSHPSILEVVTFSEAAQQDQGTVDFVDTVMSPAVKATENINEPSASYNITNCTKEYDQDNKYINDTETCTIEFSIPIDYNIVGTSYTVNVSIGDEVVPVTVQGSTLTGFLEGTGEYSSTGGVSAALSGSITGMVSGSVSGLYSGTVSGQISATVQATGSWSPGVPGQVTVKNLSDNFLVNPATVGVLTDVPDSFTSTVKKQEDDVSHVAILYAKRPGTSILSAMDKQGCIASFEIDVIRKVVALQMVGRQPGDVLDVSDTVQINAFTGGANQELNEYENITAASGIEWFSSNPDVATIDQTGLLTALKPGVTNITARYDTGEAEIGTIESAPMQVTVNKISKLRVTFDKGTQNKLPAAVVKNAHKSVIIAIHNPEAAGQTFVIEGQTVAIELPSGTYTNNISKVEAITADLAAKIAALDNSLPLPAASVLAPIVKVTTIDGYPGMLVLHPINQVFDNNGNQIEDINENGIIDIGTTALEIDVSILPTYNNAIPLPASETYGLKVIAQYNNGATKLLPPTQFSWVNTPVSYLDQASLDSGLIKMGDKSGTSTVVAEYKNADGSVVQSNYLTITVDSGPVIEFVRRIGSGSITKGSRILLQTKISDVDTISDIKSISTSLVYSSFNTYQQINQDPGAIWFSATPFPLEVEVVDQGNTGSGEGGETEGSAAGSAPAPVVLQYKTYNIPLEIPVDQNLFDGVYQLVLSISDAANHTLNYVYPIRIGEIAGGDVDGNGVVNMIDVILAFQIATGLNPSPTPAQLQAANVDGVGGVTLIDVILLFNKVTNKL